MLTTLFFLSSGLFLGWSLGANDAANIFGTAVGTKMVRFRVAALVASAFVVVGAVAAGTGASETLGRLGSVNALPGAFTVALAAALTVLWMTRLRLPVSTTQAIVGAIIGWNLFAGMETDFGALTTIVSSWIAGPLLAMLVAAVLYFLARSFLRHVRIGIILQDDADPHMPKKGPGKEIQHRSNEHCKEGSRYPRRDDRSKRPEVRLHSCKEVPSDNGAHDGLGSRDRQAQAGHPEHGERRGKGHGEGTGQRVHRAEPPKGLRRTGSRRHGSNHDKRARHERRHPKAHHLRPDGGAENIGGIIRPEGPSEEETAGEKEKRGQHMARAPATLRAAALSHRPRGAQPHPLLRRRGLR